MFPTIDHAPLNLANTLRSRGFEELTAIQAAVLSPELEGKDLRIASQTGSGKTVALGFVLSPSLDSADQTTSSEEPRPRPRAQPSTLIVAPTRELAIQLARELSWLFAPLGARVTVATGGTSVDQERRELARLPQVVIGTPGRLLDHLRRGALSLESLHSFVLDEADEMLDMGFEEELNAIIAQAPKARRTHLVSATFGHRARSMARRIQTDAVEVHGENSADGHRDIAQVAMYVKPSERADAVVNLLLRYPEDKTLVFVRTRADAQHLASLLRSSGFHAGALSGEMSQRERSATFAAFRNGTLRTLVATDVAARGLDVDDIRRVVQYDLPSSPEVLTHRSGRTGRAGRAGENVLFTTRGADARLRSLLRAAGLRAETRPVPTPASIESAADERLKEQLRMREAEPRFRALAEKLLVDEDPAQIVAALLARSTHRGPCPPRTLSAVPSRNPSQRSSQGPSRGPAPRPKKRDGRAERPRQDHSPQSDGYVTFQVSWGTKHGADPRRILALVCRRGRVTRRDIGSIRLAPASSTVQVATHCVEAFEASVTQPDARDPRVKFRRYAPRPHRR